MLVPAFEAILLAHYSREALLRASRESSEASRRHFDALRAERATKRAEEAAMVAAIEAELSA